MVAASASSPSSVFAFFASCFLGFSSSLSLESLLLSSLLLLLLLLDSRPFLVAF
jgi:hypothetical protein